MRNDRNRREDHMLKALGEAIRNRRIDLSLTQEELGLAGDLHRTYITDVESGARNLSILTLIKLVKALQCPLSQILLDAEKLDHT